MGRYGIKINRFDGGLNTKVSPELGELNESPHLLNVDFDALGAVTTRRGRSTIGTVGSGEVSLLHSYRRDGGDPDLLAVCSGHVYHARGDSTSFGPCSGGTAAMTAGVQAYGLNMQNHAFIANGTKAYKWDGNTLTRWSPPVPPPMSTPLYNSSISSTTQSWYGASWIKTYTDALGVESEASSAITGNTLLSGAMFIVTAPSVTDGAAFVNIYRATTHNEPGGSGGKFRLLTSVANPTADFVVMDEFKTALSDAVEYEVIGDPSPPGLNVFAEHLGRLWGAGPNHPTFLYYTYASQPTRWDPEYYIRVGDGDGLPIRGIVSMGQHLLIAKEDGKGNGTVWILYTPDNEPLNWSIQRLDLAYGSVSAKAMVGFAGFILLLNRSGVYDLAEGTVGERISNALSFNIEPDVLKWNVDGLHNAVAVNYNNQVYLSIPTLGYNNDQLWVYDYVKGRSEVSKYTGAWSKWDNQSISDMCIHNDKLYSGDYQGNIHLHDQGWTDAGEPIESYWRSMSIRGIPEHVDNEKIFRFIWLTVECTGDWSLDVTYASDLYATEGTTTTVSLDPRNALYGTAIVGTDMWGATRKRYTARIPINVAAKRLQVQIGTNQAGQHWQVHDMLIEYNLRGVR